MTRVRVYLRARHIKSGVRHDLCRCPVARATLEALPGAEAVETSPLQIWIYPWNTSGPADHYVTPMIVGDFIRNFDAGRPVEPFSFEIMVPDWAMQANEGNASQREGESMTRTYTILHYDSGFRCSVEATRAREVAKKFAHFLDAKRTPMLIADYGIETAPQKAPARADFEIIRPPGERHDDRWCGGRVYFYELCDEGETTS